MWIYKITNIQNNKVYIGQTIRPVKDRFNRHINDALNNIIDTHFARAIRKHGKENFSKSSMCGGFRGNADGAAQLMREKGNRRQLQDRGGSYSCR